MNQFDITLDVLLVNQTNDTLQNLTLELSTLGEHKLLDKPRPITLAAQDFANICANIKACYECTFFVTFVLGAFVVLILLQLF